MRFRDLSIGIKTIIPMIALMSVIIIVTAVGSNNLLQVTGTAREVIEKTDPATVLLARSNRQIQTIGYLSYMAMTYPSDSPQYKQISEQFENSIATVEKNFARSEILVPDFASDLRDLLDEFHSLLPELREQMKAATDAESLSLGARLTVDQLTYLAQVADSQATIDEKISSWSVKSVGLVDRILQKAAGQAQDLQATASSATNTVLAVALLGGILGFAFAFWISSRQIVHPINALNLAMRSLATGQLNADVPGTTRKDEIGEMAGAVEIFKQAGLENLRLSQNAEASRRETEEGRRSAETERARNEADRTRAAEQQAIAVQALGSGLARLAEGDLTARIDAPFEGQLDQIRVAYNDALEKFATTIGRLRQTSGALKSATGEILAGSNDLAERTTKQAAAIEETSAAIEQLNSTVNANAERAEEASRMSRTVSATAEQTGEVMEQSNAAMDRISSSSQKISNIIGMIDDIAFQTNLLALNASVEAARAGDAGKGFAVVAVEVRRLAQSAAQASAEVKVLIEQSASEVLAGGRLVADATQKLIAMVSSVKDSAELIQDISLASQEQASAIAQVSTAIRQMDEMTQHNAALVEETNAAIEQTENQANDLDGIVEQFVVEGASYAQIASAPPRKSGSIQKARPAVEVRPNTPGGVASLKQKVRTAARNYLNRGSAVVRDEEKDWQGF
jgi:methyl-accepting chemotaxis protein